MVEVTQKELKRLYLHCESFGEYKFRNKIKIMKNNCKGRKPLKVRLIYNRRIFYGIVDWDNIERLSL